MRTVAVVTTSRADFDIYRPILQHISTRDDLQCQLVVSGSHLLQRYGMTVRDIESSGFPIAARVPVFDESQRDTDVPAAMARGIAGFAAHLKSASPDVLMILGDRFEMFSAALAAMPLKVPMAHVHGGEVTAGAFDDSIRHAITKLAHLHFVSTETYARRIEQLGEEPWRITVSGAPALDSVAGFVPVSLADLNSAVGLPAGSEAPVLITFHPATLDALPPQTQIANLLSALTSVDGPLLFTAPNADPGSGEIRRAIDTFAAGRAGAVIAESLGGRLYWSAMAHARAMVGNSSSGIIEAASFGLPVVDIGSRQLGRLKPDNVISTSNDAADIRRGIARALDPEFCVRMRGLQNPYFRGGASQRIADTLAAAALDDRLIMKRFCDIARLS